MRLIELDAAANRHVVLAGHHLGRGEIDRVEPGGAEPAELHARYFIAVAGLERGRARDHAAGLPDRIDTTHHHVVDQGRLEFVAILDGGERVGREIECGHLVQGTVRLAAPARSADVVINKCVGHGGFSW